MGAENLAFGSGGALLQKVNRGTFKCSDIVINGTNREVFKDPITDSGKASKKGRLMFCKADDVKAMGFTDADEYKPRAGPDGVPGGTGFLHYAGDFCTVASGKGDATKDLLVEVFKDGELKKDWTFDEIREKADMPNGPWYKA